MIVPNPYAHHPPRWAEYRSAASLVGLCSAFTRAAEVNRFGARYRLAKACEVRLAGYTPGTTAGYDSLVKVALTWSAFESLLVALGLGKHGVATVSARHDFADVFAAMRAAGKVIPFFKFVWSLTVKVSGRRSTTSSPAGRAAA